jgi:alpha-tubulin suppressor-like RCC1 family protein
MASDRAVYCWGENDSGQLGNGEANATFNSGDTAVYRVASDVKFVSVDAGFVSTCAVAVNGDQYCWGDGTQIDARADGECRHAAAVTACALRPAKTSLRNVTGMTSGLDHRCAVSEGRVRCWGDNQSFAVSSDTSVVGTRRRDAQAR